MKMGRKTRGCSAAIGVLVIFLSLFCVGCESRNEQETVSCETAEIFAMDTIMNLTVYGDQASELLSEARQMIQRYEQLFSVTIQTSDVAKLNRAGGETVQVAPETYDLLQKSVKRYKETEGLFNVSVYPLVRAWGFTTGNYRIPANAEIKHLLGNIDASRICLKEDNQVMLPKGMEIDLGGVAKGYLSQKLTEMFRERGALGAVICLGGNVQTFGKKPTGDSFLVGITDPSDGVSVLGTVRVGEKAVVTSGSYQRYFEKNGKNYHHIIDPATGKPAQSDLVSVTVLADDGTIADSLATALFIMGRDKTVEYVENHPEIQVVLVDNNSKIWTSEGVHLDK